MNRLGWCIVIVLFAVGVFLFWSIERNQSDDLARSYTLAASGVPPIDAPDTALVNPVPAVPIEQLVDTWLQSRAGGSREHQAIDIAAPFGTPVVAAMPGRVEKLFTSAAGGTTAYVRSVDGRWLTYYAHLAGYAKDLAEGQAVAAGQPIGFVGDTGNAGAGNTHLHFALHRMAARDRWYQGTPVNPLPYLVGKPAAR